MQYQKQIHKYGFIKIKQKQLPKNQHMNYLKKKKIQNTVKKKTLF